MDKANLEDYLMCSIFSPQMNGDSPDKQGIVKRLYKIIKEMSNEV